MREINCSKVNAWIENIGTSIKNATEYTIARIGLRATSEVCRLVQNELNGELQLELQREAEGYANCVRHYRDNLEQIAEQGKIGNNNKILKKCLDSAIRDAAAVLDQKLAEHTQLLCSEVSKRYLKPMQKALDNALELAITESKKWTNMLSGMTASPRSLHPKVVNIH